MDMDEYVRLLLTRARQYDPWNADRIVGYIVGNKSPEEIRLYSSAPDEQLHTLFVEAITHAQQFQQLPPQQPPSSGPFPLVHWRRNFYPSGDLLGCRTPPVPIDQIIVRPQQHHQFHPSSNSQEIQGPPPPIGPIPTGAFQSPYSEIIGFGQHLQSPGDAIPSNHRNKGKNVAGYPPRSSNKKTQHCHFYFSTGCKRGANCWFSHVAGSCDKLNERQVRYLESLHMLEKDIRGLLSSQRLPVRIEHLANMYVKRYGKPMKIEGFHTEGQQNGNAGYSLTSLLVQLDTTRVIERQGYHYIVLVEHASQYLDSWAEGFKLVIPPESSYEIYITMHPESTFTEEDVYNYFRKYGFVEEVRIPSREKRMFGYVRFQCPQTVKEILSERSPNTPHLISGGKVYAKLCYGKGARRFAQRDVRSTYNLHEVSDLNDIGEYHTGEKLSSGHGLFPGNLSHKLDLGKSSVTIAPEMASPPTHNMSLPPVNEAGSSQGDNKEESPDYSNRLDEASAGQDRNDSR